MKCTYCQTKMKHFSAPAIGVEFDKCTNAYCTKPKKTRKIDRILANATPEEREYILRHYRY